MDKQDEKRLDSGSGNSEWPCCPDSVAGGRILEIHVKGHLDSKWSDWLEGLEMKLLDNGEMILSGPIVDQAALMGILNKLSRLNLTLISLNEAGHEK